MDNHRNNDGLENHGNHAALSSPYPGEVTRTPRHVILGA
jgi:hypothetical protein